VKNTKLDEIDFRILNLLVRNGRASFARLGEEVDLSPHGAADRVRRLLRDDVITQFTAIVDLGTVGRDLDALIDASLRTIIVPEKFEQKVGELHAVRELTFLTGRFDYQLRVACCDRDELDHTVRAIRKAGAAQTETRIVMRATAYIRPVRGTGGSDRSSAPPARSTSPPG
jgi:Lrp/AsnC family leucine-responsive transcriptional regulator